MDINTSEAPDQDGNLGLDGQPVAPPSEQAGKIDMSEAPDQVFDVEDAYKSASAESPDRAAQVISISSKLGTDPQVVDKNFDEAQRAAASPGQDYWLSLKERNPAVYDWYANRSNMALVHDDIGALEYISQTIESGTAGWELGNVQGRLGDEGRRAMDEVGQIGVLSEPTKQRLAEVRKLEAEASKRAEKYKDGFVYAAAQVLPFMTRPFVSGGAGGETEIGKGAIGLGAGAAAGAVVGALGGPVGALAGAGIGAAVGNWRASADVEGGLSFVEYIQDGLDPVRSKEVATVVGEINGALEGASDIVLGKMAGKIAGRVGGKLIPQSALDVIAKVPGGAKLAQAIDANPSVFAGMTLPQALRRAGKVVIKSMAVESSTEFLQEITPQVGKAAIEGATIDPDMAGQILSNATQVIPQTLKAMTVLGGLGGSVHLALDIRDMRKAEATKQVVEALGDAVKKSKLLQRAPEKLAEFVNTVTKDGPVKEVYISPAALESFFQGAALDMDQAAAELGVSEALKESRETGDKIAIPLGLFAEKIGANPEMLKAISADVSFRRDVPSSNEVKQAREELDALGAEVAARLNGLDSAENIYQALSQQLKQAKDGKQKARILSEGYRVMAARMEKTPEQVWNDVMKLSIIGVDEIRMGGSEQYQPTERNRTRQSTIPMPDQVRVIRLESSVDGVSAFDVDASKSDKKPLQSAARESARKFQKKTFKNEHSGWDVTVAGDEIKKALSGAARAEHAIGIANLDKLIASAVYESDATDLRGRDGTVFRYLYSLARVGYKDVLFKIVVKDAGSKKFYDSISVENERPAVLAGSVAEPASSEPSVVSIADFENDLNAARKLFPMFQAGETSGVSPLGFYSQVRMEVDKMDFKQIPGKDLASRIKNTPGVKAEELETLGILDWLNAVEGKVSKEQVLQFIDDNGVKVEQTVLSPDGGPDDATSALDEVEWEDRGRDTSNDSEEINQQVENDMYDKSLMKERLEEAREALLADYTDADGNIDERGLEQAMERKVEEDLYESAREYVESDDYYNAQWMWRERASGWDLIGNDEYGWYCPDNSKHYDGSLEEAKIQMVSDAIDSGAIEGDKSKLVRADDIRWGSRRGDRPSDRTMKAKVKAHLAKHQSRIIEAVKAENASYYAELSPEDLASNIKTDSEYMARQEVEESYADPSNKRNTVSWTLKHPIISGNISGNNVKGYTFTSEDLNGGPLKLDAKTPEEAEADAVKALIEAGVIYSDQKVEEDPDADHNTPTGRSFHGPDLHRGRSIPGAENYREILLTLPGHKGDTFTYDAHFRGHKNVVAFARVSDRVDSEGRKALFVEELQSDWHQQGREKGYKTGKPKGLKVSQVTNGGATFEIVDENGEFVTNVSDDGSFEGREVTPENAVIIAQERVDSDNPTGFQRNAVPDAPFKNTEAWASLVMKRIMRLAVEQGYDAVAWTPAEVHVDRWGTDSISWVKKQQEGWVVKNHSGEVIHTSGPLDTREAVTELMLENFGRESADFQIEKPADYWLVGSVEQVGGNVDGINIEDMARRRGQLLERRGERVTSKEELRAVIGDTLGRERQDRSLDSLTESIWKQMQSNESGVKAPRKEGMEFFYDNMLPKKVVPSILKKLDKEAKVVATKVNETSTSKQTAWEVVLTDALRAKVQEGLPLFQRSGDQARGQITFTAREAVMALSKIKDESTMFHESGHFFLQLLESVASEDGAPASVRQDYLAVRQWMGLKDGEKIQREHHEKFADAFMVYVYEGKTPNPAIQGVFDRFRRWVISFWKILTSQDLSKKLGVELTPELRAVMDRLLATDEEIELAKLQSGFVGIQSQGAELSLDQLSRLQELQRTAHAKALATLLGGQIRDLEAEGLEQYAAKEAEQRKQAKEQLEALPAFRAGRAIVKQLKSKQSAVQVMRDYLLGKKSKHWPTLELIAEMHGYPSTEKMAEDIITSKDLDEAVEAEVKNRMSFDYHRKLIDREAIREQAQEILHNERSLDILALEQEYLTDLLRGVEDQKSRAKDRAALRSGQLQYARQRAKEIVGRMSTDRVRKLGPFYTIERRSSQAVGRALGQKKYDEAAKLKGQQMLNHAVASEAAKAKARVVKGLSQLEKIRRRDKESFKTEEHFAQVGALLARMGMNHPAYSPAARTETLAEWAARMEGMTNAVAIPDWVMNESVSLDPKRLTVDQFADALDAVKNVIQVANLENRALTIMGKVDLSEVVTKLQASRDENIKGRKPYLPSLEPDSLEKATEIAAGYALSMIRIQNLAKSIQGFAETGPWTEVFERSVDRAGDVESRLKREYMKKLEELYKPYSDAERYAMGTRKIFVPEFGSSVTKSFLIALARNLGNAGNRSKLLSTPVVGLQDPSTWSEELLMSVLERELDARDWRFVQGAWDLIDSLWPKIVELHREVTGFTPGKVEAVPFVVRTKDGEMLSLAGGYYPLARDPRASRAQEILTSLDTPLFKEGNSSWRAATRTGHTKARVSAEYAVAVDEGILYRHITDVIHDLAFRKLVIDLGRIMNQPAVRQMIQERHGNPGVRLFDEFVRSMAFEERPPVTPIETVMNELRKNTAITYMAFSIRNIVQNFSNFWLYGGASKDFSAKDWAALGLKHAQDAAMNRAEFHKMREFVFSLSPFMKDKNERPDISYSWLSTIGVKKRGVKRAIISRVAGEGAVSSGADKIAVGLESVIEFGRGLMAGTDEITSVPVWVAAYNKALDQGKSQEDAIDYADNIIRATLGSGRRIDAAPMLRSPNSMIRIISMFMTFVNTQANRMYLETGRAMLEGNPERQAILRVMTDWRYLGYVFASLFAFPLTSSILAFKGPDEDDDKLKWAAKEIIGNPVSFLPGARDVISPLVGELLGVEGFSQRRGSAVMGGIDAGMNTFKTLLNEDKTFADVLESLTKTGAFLVPYPNQINTLLWNSYDIGRGAMKPEVSDVVRRRPRAER